MVLLGKLRGRVLLFAYRTITSYGRPFQCHSAKQRFCNFRIRPYPDSAAPTTSCWQHIRSHTPVGFGLFPFRSPLLRESILFLFLEVLRWFSSLRSLPGPMYSDLDDPGHPGTGYPIRKSPDQCLLTAPRSLSQLATSFIASQCQDIHRTPLLAWSHQNLKTPTTKNHCHFHTT